ncbi:MAG: glycoside hydrolase family 99-like domain-containing protein, partial [Halobacteriaceae archaeon]
GCNEQNSHSPSKTTTTESTKETTTGGTAEGEGPTEDSEDGWQIDPIETDKIVAAYYYGWYKPWENWLNDCVSEPKLGEYNSRDETVINQHIKWARESGINTWVLRWIDSEWEDETVRNYILDAELSDQIDIITIPSKTAFAADPDYEFGDTLDFDKEANRKRLREVFGYLDDTLFDRPNHVTVNGRPVMVIFEMGVVTGDYSSAIQEAKAVTSDPPYIIADLEQFLGSGRVDKSTFEGIDAATTYSLHFEDKIRELDFPQYTSWLTRQGKLWRLAADNWDLDFVPTVMPGYNNSKVSEASDPVVLEPTPKKFSRLIDSQIHNLDPDLNMIFVTTWNEWYEDTSVEPRDDYGNHFLNLVKEKVAKYQVQPIKPMEDFHQVRLSFNKTVQPDGSDRYLAIYLTDMIFEGAGGTNIERYDVGIVDKEPHLVEGAYSPEKTPSWGSGRWLGGKTERTTIYVPKSVGHPERLTLIVVPIESNTITIEVFYNGKQTDRRRIGERRPPTSYTFSLKD